MKNRYNRKEPKIHQSAWGTWRVRFFDEEKDDYREKVVKTKTEAENLKRAMIRDDDLSFWFPDKERKASTKNFHELAEKWLDHAEHVRRISVSCLTNYRSHLRNHIFPVLGEIPLRKLKLDHIEELAKAIAKKKAKTKSYQAIRKSRWDERTEEDEDGLSLSYQKEILTVACMIMTWASKRRPPLIPENLFETFVLPKTPEHLYDYWSLDDEDKFLDWLEGGAYYEKVTTRYHHVGEKVTLIKLQLRNHEELRDIILVALRTGMRLGEIGGLRNADVDLAQGFIMVRGSYCSKEGKRKNTTKNKKARRIEINKDVRQILRKRQHKPQMEALFNIHMNSIKFFSRTCRLAGVKEIHFHSLRHTCLTNLANGYGMGKPLPLPKVQQIAGHSDIKTTMRYVHGDIINETASLQWSREDRKKKGDLARRGSLHSPEGLSRDDNEILRDAQDDHLQGVQKESEEVRSTTTSFFGHKKGLRLVSSGKNISRRI